MLAGTRLEYVPDSAEQSAEREALARAAADRRRQVVTVLRITECTCGYAASRIGNGASPEEAVATALFVAEELAEVATALRRLARPDPAARRALAVALAARGTPIGEVAELVGVTRKTARAYLCGPADNSERLPGRGPSMGQEPAEVLGEDHPEEPSHRRRDRGIPGQANGRSHRGP